MQRIEHQQLQHIRSSCALSDNVFVTEDDNGVISVWDISSSEKLLNTWQSNNKPQAWLVSLCKINDKTFARVNNSGSIEIWDIDWKCKQILHVPVSSIIYDQSPVKYMIARGNGQLAISLTDRVEIWDLATATRKSSFQLRNRLGTSDGGRSYDWHIPRNPIVLPDSKIAFTTFNSDDKRHGIVVWNVENDSHECFPIEHDKLIFGFALLSPHHLVTASQDGTIKVWNIANKSVVSSTSSADKLQYSSLYQLRASNSDIFTAFDGSRLYIYNLTKGFIVGIRTSIAFVLDDTNTNIWIKESNNCLIKINILKLLENANICDVSEKLIPASLAYQVQNDEINSTEIIIMLREKIVKQNDEVKLQMLRNSQQETIIDDLKNNMLAQAKLIEALQHQVQEISGKVKTEQEFLNEMLLNASKSGHLKKMERALEMGASIEAVDAEGCTPLFLSIFHGHFDIANALLTESKAGLETPNKQRKTILHVASEMGDLDTVKFILSNLPQYDKEAKLLLSAHEIAQKSEIKQIIADTILFQAAKQGNTKLTEKSLEIGANIDAQDNYSETALHKACYSNHVDVVKSLLKKSCSISKTDKNNQTAIEVTSNLEIKRLISGYENQKASTIQACFRGFFHRKMSPLQQAKNNHRQDIQTQCSEAFSRLAKDGDFDGIKKLATAIEENRLHDAVQIIRNIPEKQMEARTGLKLKY